MNIRTLLLGIITFIAIGNHAQTTKYVGGDVSMLPKYEEANVAYYDINGTKIENGKLLEFFRDDAGFNIVRVRLFVNPTGENGVCQDLDYVKRLGKRIKDAGLKFMLDFHYSDTWADPEKQYTPSAWTSLSDADLYTKIYEYTKECLTTLKDYGATPDFIQTGNEISYGMLWGASGSSSLKKCYTSNSANWDRFITLLTKAGQACREICPQAKIIIHTERTGNWSTTKGIYDKLSSVDYDIIGLSYYPEWHNSIATLKTTLTNCHSTYPAKDVMIVETGYYNNWYRSDATYNFESTWPASPAGQKAFLTDLVTAIKDLSYVTGLLYWFPEENQSAGNTVYAPWYNHGLFSTSNGHAVEALYVLHEFLGKGSSQEHEVKQLYALGTGAELGDWKLTSTKAMTACADGVSYYIDVKPTGDCWLCFSDGTVTSDSDWDTYNATYRLSTGVKDEPISIGNTYQLSKAGDFSMKLSAGEYRLTVNSKTWVLKVEDLASAHIHELDSEEAANPQIYDLQGRRVSQIQKPGVYIKNKRKVIQK